MFCGGHNKICEPLQASYTLVAVKTHYASIYRPPTRFAVLENDSANLYRLPTRFVAVITNSQNLYSTFCGDHNRLSEPL